MSLNQEIPQYIIAKGFCIRWSIYGSYHRTILL